MANEIIVKVTAQKQIKKKEISGSSNGHNSNT